MRAIVFLFCLGGILVGAWLAYMGLVVNRYIDIISHKMNKSRYKIIVIAVLTIIASFNLKATNGTLLSEGETNGYIQMYISNVNDLLNFIRYVEEYGMNVNAELTADIDLSTVCGDGTGGRPDVSWDPIGLHGFSYAGHFDGGGKTIKNLYINSDEENIGLFSRTSGATIENLNVEGTVIGSGNYVGGICGFAHFSLIDNIGTVISNCSFSGQVSGADCVGGICGATNNNVLIESCVNMGQVSGAQYVGGICGKMGGSYIGSEPLVLYCYNGGRINGTESNIGGVCGYSSLVQNSVNTGRVTGSSEVGAISGAGTTYLCYYDKQMCVSGGVDGMDVSGGAEGKLTTEMTGNQLFDDGENWYEDGNLYPFPKNFGEYSPAVVSATPLFLSNGEKVNNVISGFTVSTDNGVSWDCGNTGLFVMDGTNVTIGSGVFGCDTLFAKKDGVIYKTVLLSVANSGPTALTIDNLADFVAFRDAVNEGSGYKGISGATGFEGIHFRLTADLDMSSVCYEGTGGASDLSWIPVGSEYPFCGYFHGSGNTIKDLYINSETDNLGLFGNLYMSTVDSLHLESTVIISDVDNAGGLAGKAIYSSVSASSNSGFVSGNMYVGGIIGQSAYSEALYCFSSGHVDGSTYLGGIIGYSDICSTIKYCSNGCIINGSRYIGGICGIAKDSDIQYCLNFGEVFGMTEVGAIIGSGSIPVWCYYDKQICDRGGVNDNDIENGAEGRYTSEMIGIQPFDDAENWFQNEDMYPVPKKLEYVTSAKVASNPVFFSFAETATDVKNSFTLGTENGTVWECGSSGVLVVDGSNGTLTGSVFGPDTLFAMKGETVYKKLLVSVGNDETTSLTIDNLEEFVAFRDAVNNRSSYKGVDGALGFRGIHFILTDNIDLSSVCGDGSNGSADASWEPIGTSVNFFSGHFHGNGMTMKNTYINVDINYINTNGRVHYIGLFGVIFNASIDNLHLIGTDISGVSSFYVGGICARGYSSNISYCSNSGIVYGLINAGGICSLALSTNIEYCVNSCSVDGSEYIGGICGDATDGVIRYCLNSGTINSSHGFAGGICGKSVASVQYCINAGQVKGPESYGSIIGSPSMVNFCYYDKQICTVGGRYPEEIGDAEGKLTTAMTGDQLFTYSEDWDHIDGLYPVPKGMGDIPSVIVAATPVYLHVNSGDNSDYDNSDNVLNPFALESGNGVCWESSDASLLKIVDGVGTISRQTNDTTVLLKASFLGGEKLIPLILGGGESTEILWGDPSAIEYGTLIGPDQLNATANVPGTMEYDPVVGSTLSVGTHELTAFFTPADLNQYLPSERSVSITVTRKNPDIIWEAPDDMVYGTPLGESQLNAIADIQGTLSYSLSVGDILDAGEYEITVSFIPSNTTNYLPVEKTVPLIVIKATPQIYWDDPADIVYGTPLVESQLNASSDIEGLLTYTPGSGVLLDAGEHVLNVMFVPADELNYNTVVETVNITVTKAVPEISWVPPSQITVGTPLDETQLNASSDVDGIFTYEPDFGSVLTVGEHMLSVTFTPSDILNYTGAEMSVALTVNEITSLYDYGNTDLPYPNPTANGIFIEVGAVPVDVRLYSSTGKLIKIEKATGLWYVDMDNLPSGNYFVLFNGVTYKVVKK